MMKTNYILAFSAFASMAFLASCDNVAEPDRTIPVERAPVARRVLIQEFTGQNCTNCPDGAFIVHNIQESYPDAVIAVSLHPENTAFTIQLGTQKLTSAASTEYFKYYNPPAFPAACIDGDAPVIDMQSWAALVSDAISVEAPGEIMLEPSYDPATRVVKVKYAFEANTLYTEPLNMVVQVVENGIVAPQATFTSFNMKYVHNHVLRACMTPIWGESLAANLVVAQQLEGQCEMTLDETWVPENIDIVAFAVNANTKKTEQAFQTPLLPKAPEAEAE